MASKFETILSKLKTLAQSVQSNGSAAFVEVTNQLRPFTAVMQQPACDIVADRDVHVAFIDEEEERQLIVSWQIVQRSDPDVPEGKRIGDLWKAFRTALWADRCLTGSARSLTGFDAEVIFPLVKAGGQAVGITGTLKFSYRE